MNKGKTTKPTIRKKKPAKNRVWDEEYFDIFTFKVKPVSDIYMEKLAEKMREWAQQDDSLRLEDFYDLSGISPDNFERWYKRSLPLKTIHDYTIRRLASRREIGALKNELNVSMVCKTLGHYCKIYDSEEEKRIKRHEKERSKEEVLWVMEKAKSSDKVPDKPAPKKD